MVVRLALKELFYCRVERSVFRVEPRRYFLFLLLGDLERIDFAEGTGVRKLDLHDNR